MNKKVIIVVFIVIVIIISLIIYPYINSDDSKILEQTFAVSAIYYENDGYAKISFQDKSNKTKHVTLEILGMSESFHKEYISPQFEAQIQFTSKPKYGWQSVPVTFLVNHEDYGNIGIKIEIWSDGEIPTKKIFSKGL